MKKPDVLLAAVYLVCSIGATCVDALTAVEYGDRLFLGDLCMFIAFSAPFAALYLAWRLVEGRKIAYLVAWASPVLAIMFQIIQREVLSILFDCHHGGSEFFMVTVISLSFSVGSIIFLYLPIFRFLTVKIRTYLQVHCIKHFCLFMGCAIIYSAIGISLL